MFMRNGITPFTLLLIIFVISISGCASNNPSVSPNTPASSNNTSKSSYIVIDEIRQETPEVIEGPGLPSMVFVDDATPVPVYFDQPGRYVTVNNSLKILCFSYYMMGNGLLNNLTSVYGIYGFPCLMASGVTILGVENDTIQMKYDGELINLSQGENWSSPVVSSRIGNYSAYPGNSTVKYTANWQIYNMNGTYYV